MPVTKSAKKKLRVDRRKTTVNKIVRSKMKNAIKKARSEGTKESVGKAYSAIDRARKKGVVKKNKAARLKSRLVALVKRKFGKTVF